MTAYIIKGVLHLVVVLINRETKSSLEKVPSPIPPGAIRETVDTDIVVAGAGLFERAAAASAMHSLYARGNIACSFWGDTYTPWTSWAASRVAMPWFLVG